MTPEAVADIAKLIIFLVAVSAIPALMILNAVLLNNDDRSQP